MEASTPGWIGIFLFGLLLLISVAAHIKSSSYLAACAISGLLTLVVSVMNYTMHGFNQYQRSDISLSQFMSGFPYSLIGIFPGFIVSALVGIPIWLYKRATHHPATTQLR